MADGCITPQEFTQFLVTQEPVFDKVIIHDIRPEDGWIGHVETGLFPAFSGVEHTYDRFRQVMPNVTKEWETVPTGSCVGAPCDPTPNRIGWGWERNTYFLERQYWETDLLCYYSMMTLTRAKEHFGKIISDILKPATSRIMSFYLRKRAADHAGVKWVANAAMTAFTYTWTVTGDQEIYMVPTAEPTSKLTPQMLQRRVNRLRLVGYMGKMPFRDMPPLIELVTDDNTLWDLDKAAQDSAVSDKWRFNDWGMANRYYKYFFTGQLGDYVVRVDPFIIRFNKVSSLNFQVVLPYRNVPTTEGIGSEPNPDFDTAQFQWSHIWHRRALQILVQQMEPVNSLMPFAQRSMAGEWQFAMNNLGADCLGRPIDNKLGNKGMFVAIFQLAAKPQYTEFSELIFHKREPAYVVAVDDCAADPGYPYQYYNSSNTTCSDDTIINPAQDDSGNYVIAVNSVTCDGVPYSHAAISEATLPDLLNALNTELSMVGLWVADGAQILLTESQCSGELIVPFVT